MKFWIEAQWTPSLIKTLSPSHLESHQTDPRTSAYIAKDQVMVDPKMWLLRPRAPTLELDKTQTRNESRTPSKTIQSYHKEAQRKRVFWQMQTTKTNFWFKTLRPPDEAIQTASRRTIGQNPRMQLAPWTWSYHQWRTINRRLQRTIISSRISVDRTNKCKVSRINIPWQKHRLEHLKNHLTFYPAKAITTTQSYLSK